MKKGLLYIFLLPAIQSLSQTVPDIKKMVYGRWKENCALLEVKADTFFYSNRVDSSTIECALISLSEASVYKKWNDLNNTDLTDSIVLSSSEISYIRKGLQKQIHQEWPDHLYEKSYRVQRSDIEKIIAGIDKRNLGLAEKMCKEIYTFSEPIIIRKRTISIIYIETDDVMKTDGGIWIYLKKGKEWIRFSALCYQHPINSYRNNFR